MLHDALAGGGVASATYSCLRTVKVEGRNKAVAAEHRFDTTSYQEINK